MEIGIGCRINDNPFSRFYEGETGIPFLFVHPDQAGLAHLEPAAITPEAEGRIYLVLDSVQQNQNGEFLVGFNLVLKIRRLSIPIRVKPKNDHRNRLIQTMPPA
jgi:hypothetical protein